MESPDIILSFGFDFGSILLLDSKRHHYLSKLNTSSIMRILSNTLKCVQICNEKRGTHSKRLLKYEPFWLFSSKDGDLVMSFLCIIISFVGKLGRVKK